jgi:cytochrome c biogenesis protein CcmG, thiol:disulfide interchange protein DsbE
MKNSLMLAFFFAASALFAQKSIPSAQVKKLDGSSFDIAELAKAGHPIVISFWATWCSPCKKELDAISEVYAEWKEKYGVEVIAVSVDDARSAPKVKPMVEQKGWEYTILLDSNQDFQRAMNIESVPYSFLMDAKGQIVFEHSGYVSGDELELEEKLKELTKK